MREALADVEGERDFAPFSGPLSGGKTTIRRLLRSVVWQEGDEVYLELEGNSFLRQQVRRLAAALLVVGLGKQTVGEFRALADSGVRGAAHRVLPAQGLCLRHVYYQSFPPRDHARQSNHDTSVTRSGELALAGR
jgi:tRNA pseudouridine38-40 synthase